MFCVVFWMTLFSYVKRDVLHVLPFVLNFGIWFSPVFYSASILPERYRFLLEINPLTSVVQMWRWCLFDYGNFNFMWIVNFVWVVLLLLSGIYIYNRKEDNFSDFV